MNSELGNEVKLHAKQARWVIGECRCITYGYGRLFDYFLLGFRERLSTELEYLGDTAMNARPFDKAIFQYSCALSLEPAAPSGLLIKRSKAYVVMGLWEDALSDANKVCSFAMHRSDLVNGDHQVIALDPSSPWGYERKHTALHGVGRYDDAISAFEMMLLRISQSPDPKIRGGYIDVVLTLSNDLML